MSLDRLLGHLALTITPFAVCDVRRGAQLSMPGEHLATMHFVLAGVGTLFATSRSYGLRPYALVLVPPGMDHRVAAGSGAAELGASAGQGASSSLVGVERIVRGDGDAGLFIACGALRAEVGSVGLFERLGQPLVEPFADEPRMQQLFDTLFDEQRQAKPGHARMLEAVMTQCLVHLLRRVSQRNPAELTWLSALQQPGLSKALEQILETPQAPHSLEGLATTAAMSRTVFSERFRDAFGTSPMAFVRQARLQEAAKLLRSTDLPVKAIAARVGFASRSHFSRAFRQRFKRDPADYRGADDD